MVLLAVSGLKKTGKSTLCRTLVEALGHRGLRVGYIKHGSHAVLDDGAHDTGRMLVQEGRAVFWGRDGFRLERRGDFSPDAVARECFPGWDLVLVEGGKALPLPRLWVGLPEDRPPEVGGVVAYVGPRGIPGLPVFDPDAPEPLVDFLEALVRRNRKRATVYVGGKQLPLKDFVADFVWGSLCGMLRALKGGDDPERRGVLVALPPQEDFPEEDAPGGA